MLKETQRGREYRMDAGQEFHRVFVVFDGPLQEAGETALHYSVRTADQTSLHLVDFLVQNRYILRNRSPENLSRLNAWIAVGFSRELNRCQIIFKLICAVR